MPSRASVLFLLAGLQVSAAPINPCTSGKKITLDGKTYDTKYAIEIPAPAGTKRHVDGINTPVSAHVIGALANGSVFWDSKGPFDYRFNATPRQLIVGFDVGSYGMKVGETRKICIPENEGYGPAGRPPVIPPSATLIFTLECLSVGAVTAAPQLMFAKQNLSSNLAKLEAAIAATNPTAAALEGFTPSLPVSDKYTTIEQKVFHGIGGCATPNPAVTPIPVGKCEPDNLGGAFIMSCSADGSSFTQTQYSDATCNTKTRALPGQTGKCYKQSQLQYLEFTCKTADHYEIAQN